MSASGIRIRVRGLVQGVGFRPHTWRLAREEALTGAVWNDARGVEIEAWGQADALERFLTRLTAEAPPLARIDAIETTPLPPGIDAVETTPPPGAATSFEIRASTGGLPSAGIVADAATCPRCLKEIFDPEDRRAGYAFTNCTHCGPRLSIVTAIPYDRANTSMRAFPLCPRCKAEYHDPADRRFHAQPNACPACGPRLWIEDGQGVVACDDPIAACAARLRAGHVVAIKGLGGFHLACDATNPQAVARLRARKRRDAKPFALMARSTEQARVYCRISARARALLESPAAPIVLLPRKQDGGAPLPEAIAPDQDRLGFMLAYTPLHHLLMSQLDGPLVMTSGNLSGEPQAIDNEDARARLAGIADAWLMHDRDIVNRLDDSVMVDGPEAPMILRRARGLAPAPIALPPGFTKAPPVLALGGELKSTFCLLRDGQAVLSQHLGDLEDARAHGDYRHALDLYRRLYAFEPAVIAVDRHAGYLSTQWGTQLAAECGATLVYVQHHHAHMAAGMIDAGLDLDQECGAIVLDGLGMGDDGTLWGGEWLSGGYRQYQRFAHLPAVPLPGGNAAMREPWRNLVAHLKAAFGPDWCKHTTPLLAHLPDENRVRLIEQMIDQKLNSPACSSAGRLFDAAAAALGLHPLGIAFEAQAAMALEAVARPFAAETLAQAAACPVAPASINTPRDLWQALSQGCGEGIETGRLAAGFHHMLASIILSITQTTGLSGGEKRIVLTGGVMQNGILSRLLRNELNRRGSIAVPHRQVPANDGGLSLGQAAVAAAGGIDRP